ncbi:unnamed protein product [Brassica oleracea]
MGLTLDSSPASAQAYKFSKAPNLQKKKKKKTCDQD